MIMIKKNSIFISSVGVVMYMYHIQLGMVINIKCSDKFTLQHPQGDHHNVDTNH